MFKARYLRHVQGIFSRVQHHMHKRTKHGFVPLKACLRKGNRKSKKQATCKADFPKKHLLVKSTLVCRGVAQKLGLRISGRRNAFGSHVGSRSRPWHSATAPSFAAAFQSNTHTLPNWRLPPLKETHDDTLCALDSCVASGDHVDVPMKIASKIAQRAQRNCTGYYCGYQEVFLVYENSLVGNRRIGDNTTLTPLEHISTCILTIYSRNNMGSEISCS